MTYRALDLFCGAGGATRGLQLAGFHVTGVDHVPQPRYIGDAFHQADAMTFPLEGYDLIWASPPCQAYSSLRVMRNAGRHPLLIGEVRSRLMEQGCLYVIENVPGAPLKSPAVLCGSMFGLEGAGYQLRRHRLFEANFFIMGTSCSHHEKTVGVYGGKARDIAQEKRHYSKDKATRGAPVGVVLKQRTAIDAMGIGWMSMDEISEAIPPAYAKHIGDYAMMALDAIAAPQEEPGS